MERRIYWLLLALVIALGAFLRLEDLGGPSLWHDEIIHISMANKVAEAPWYRSLAGISEFKGMRENGPIYYWLQILGQRLVPGETGVRLFPALIGILTLPLMAWSGHLLGGRWVSLAATFFLAVSPLHVYFSREGRPYSLIMLLSLMLLHALLERGSRSGAVLTYVGCFVAVYVGVHSVPILLAFGTVSGLSWLWSLRRRESPWRSPHLRGVVAAVLALVLVYGLYLWGAETNQIDFVDLDSPVFLSPLSQRAMERFAASLTTSAHRSVLMVGRSYVLLAFSVIGVVYGLWRFRTRTALTTAMFLLTVGLSILALVATGRWYALRYTCSSLPAFLLLGAVGVYGLAELATRLATGRLPERVRRPAAAVGTALLLLVFVGPNITAARTDPHRKLDWRGVARFMEEIAIDGEPVIVANQWPETCLGYYLRGSERDLTFIDLEESVPKGQRMVDQYPMGWLMTAGFRMTGDARAWMHGFQPVLKNREEEMALFFFPDFVTLMETRFAAGKGAFFEEQFAAMNQRYDFGGAELTLQGGGWSYQETNKAGIGYQWALGEQAELGLPVAQRRNSVIRFRALPFTYPEAPEQSVELWLNDTRLGSFALPKGWSEHEVSVPADTWSDEANVLFLRFARNTVPAEVAPGSSDRRNLAAAFDFLEVVNAAD